MFCFADFGLESFKFAIIFSARQQIFRRVSTFSFYKNEQNIKNNFFRVLTLVTPIYIKYFLNFYCTQVEFGATQPVLTTGAETSSDLRGTNENCIYPVFQRKMSQESVAVDFQYIFLPFNHLCKQAHIFTNQAVIGFSMPFTN